MWIADRWKDYEVLDCSEGEKLERWGKYTLVRPDPQVIWDTPRKEKGWRNRNAHYHRSKKGGGEWEFFDLPQELKNYYPDNVPLPENTLLSVPAEGTLEEKLLAVTAESYNIADDSRRLKDFPADFEKLRGSYPLRREFPAFTVSNYDEQTGNILSKLGFKLK